MTWEQAVINFIIGSVFTLFYASFSLDAVHSILKWLLFSFGILMMAIGCSIVSYIIKTNMINPEIYTTPLIFLIVTLVILFLFYFVGFFFWGLLNLVMNQGKDKK